MLSYLIPNPTFARSYFPNINTTHQKRDTTMKEMNWSELPFGYMKTDYNVRCYYRNGEWGELEVSSSESVDIHMAATCLHYGQEAFEGLKAFMGKDGRIRVFRMDENAKRLQSSSRAIMMAELPVEKFEEAVRRVVRVPVGVTVVVMVVLQHPGAHQVHGQAQHGGGDGLVIADGQWIDHALHRFH